MPNSLRNKNQVFYKKKDDDKNKQDQYYIKRRYDEVDRYDDYYGEDQKKNNYKDEYYEKKSYTNKNFDDSYKERRRSPKYYDYDDEFYNIKTNNRSDNYNYYDNNPRHDRYLNDSYYQKKEAKTKNYKNQKYNDEYEIKDTYTRNDNVDYYANNDYNYTYSNDRYDNKNKKYKQLDSRNNKNNASYNNKYDKNSNYQQKDRKNNKQAYKHNKRSDIKTGNDKYKPEAKQSNTNNQIQLNQKISKDNELYVETLYNNYLKDDDKPHVRTIKLNKNDKLSILMIAEKPSIALSITEAVSKYFKRPFDKLKTKIPSYTVEGTFFQHPARFSITGVMGHVYSRDFPKKYSDWQKTDPFQLFDINTIKHEADAKTKVASHLEKFAHNADIVVLWLDNDKEGENICFEIIETIQDKINICTFKQYYRAYFSSLVQADLISTFLGLSKGPDAKQALAVEARQIVDLKVGVAFTRLQTNYMRQTFVDFKDAMISYGPCQIPTLGLVVSRHLSIKSFKPTKYFQLNFTGALKDKEEVIFPLTMREHDNNFNVRADAVVFRDKIKGDGKLIDIKTSEERIGNPQGLNTVNLLKHTTKNLGLGAQETMRIAERLYLSGFITYPRTESTRYPKNYNFKKIISDLQSYNNSILAAACNDLSKRNAYNPPSGVDKFDHPPIVPTGKVPNNISDIEKKVFDFVVRNFLCSIADPVKISVETYTFQFNDLKFTYKARRIVNSGYYSITGKSIDAPVIFKSKPLVGQLITMSNMKIEDKMTQPPPEMTESELIKCMDNYHIGTDASMAVHIENIINRKYITVSSDNKRELLPTDLGLKLYDSYQKVDSELCAAELRGKIEGKIDNIAEGSSSFVNVLQDILERFRTKYLHFKENIDKLAQTMEQKFVTVEQTLEEKGKSFSKCGQCKHLLSYYKPIDQMVCTTCKDFKLKLPKDAKALICNNYCTKDNYQLIEYFLLLGITHDEKENTKGNKPLKDKSKTFGVFIKVCPKCYVCSAEFSKSVLNADKCKNGHQFCLVRNKSSNIYYKLCDNYSCMTLIQLANNVKKLKLRDDEMCEKCNQNLFDVTFTDQSCIYPNEVLEKVCFNCDEKLSSNVKSLGQHNYNNRCRICD